MAVSNKFILQQGPLLGALAKTAATAALQQVFPQDRGIPVTPGPEFTATLPPRSPDLVKTYVKHVGGEPSTYRGELPPHLFPQWSFVLASKTLGDIPYPLMKVMNGGCRLEMRAPLPADEPLKVRANLQNIDDDGSRAVLHQHIVTGTESSPDAVIADLYAIVPLGRKSGKGGKKKEKPCVPHSAKELAYWKIGPNAGLDFSKLTGDFNPIHWVPVHAKAFGFKNTILHGFSTLARAIEGLNRTCFLNGTSLKSIDAQFLRPLVLPAKVGLYLDGDQVYVGTAHGGPVFMKATIETH